MNWEKFFKENLSYLEIRERGMEMKSYHFSNKCTCLGTQSEEVGQEENFGHPRQ